jgi:GNAT superfamily N-acetyltransferase
MDETSRLAERVERAALESHYDVASTEVRRGLGLQVTKIGTALVSIAAGVPGTVINRTIGLGVEAGERPKTLDSIANRYEQAGVDRYYVHLHPHAHPPELRDWIQDRGWARLRGWQKFRRGTEPPAKARSDLEVRRIGAGHALDFARIAAQGFGLSSAIVPVLAGLADHDGWRLYLCFEGETPAAAAGMFVLDDVAWLTWASTLPEYRRRGAQSALLHRRIADAIASGCGMIVTETGEAVEGDSQHSFNNILRAGFEPLYVRENFGPASLVGATEGRR